MQGTFFDGRISGLTYRTKSGRGIVTDGHYEYEPGERISFAAAGLSLGECEAKPHITPVDLVSGGDLENETVLLITRLLVSYGDGTPDAMLTIPAQGLAGASLDEGSLTARLGAPLPHVSPARNRLRRAVTGTIKQKDVRIPLRDGSYVLCDIYRPFAPGKYPVVMSMNAFGRAFGRGAYPEDGMLDKEILEDSYFRFPEKRGSLIQQGFFTDTVASSFQAKPPLPRLDPNAGEAPNSLADPACYCFERFECPEATFWNANGYAVVIADERGIGNTPGYYEQFGAKNGLDFAEAIDWIGEQDWCSGSVGIYGASYMGMNQFQAAANHPKHLKAMIPIAGDADSYNDYLYCGNGLYNYGANSVIRNYVGPGVWNGCDWQAKVWQEPFLNDETYGPEAACVSSVDLSKLDTPMYIAAEATASHHTKGSSASYLDYGGKDKKFLLCRPKGVHVWMYDEPYRSMHLRFFDYWLKGIENGIMDEPRATVLVRDRGADGHWRHEADWPIPGTTYQKLYFAENGTLTDAPAAESGSISYSADVTRFPARVPCRGPEFWSAPFEKDTEIAGYIRFGFWISSNKCDAELHIRINAVDENGEEVDYAPGVIMEGNMLGYAFSLVSHNTIDTERTTDFRCFNKHDRESCPPLTPDVPVFCQFDSMPTSAIIHKGWRLHVEVESIGNGMRNPVDEERYRAGGVNTIYTGADKASFLTLPVLPD